MRLLSDLLGLPVVDADGRTRGRICDLTTRLGTSHPVVTGLLVAVGHRDTRAIPWEAVNLAGTRVELSQPPGRRASRRRSDRAGLRRDSAGPRSSRHPDHRPEPTPGRPGGRRRVGGSAGLGSRGGRCRGGRPTRRSPPWTALARASLSGAGGRLRRSPSHVVTGTRCTGASDDRAVAPVGRTRTRRPGHASRPGERDRCARRGGSGPGSPSRRCRSPSRQGPSAVSHEAEPDRLVDRDFAEVPRRRRQECDVPCASSSARTVFEAPRVAPALPSAR